MPQVAVNGVELFYEVAGDGAPLVLVHGSWGDHHNWVPALAALTRDHRVLVYDRRGHSRSERPPGQGARREDEDDLAALMETLGFAPAFVAGNSFGASTALGLATRRPELFRGIVAHEPPLMGIVADDPEARPLMAATERLMASVVDRLRAGETAAGARQFVDEVAFGPGEWERMPDRVRETFRANAPTFADEQGDPQWADLDLGRLSGYPGPALLTKGSESPPWFARIVGRLGGALPRAATYTFEGAGHVPHVTHPAEYARQVAALVAEGRRAP
ncbi:alpha/beta hydrolase [Streptomyces cyaneochromogenes]|uniref:Alpha/beta hydrolase n=1 Tax=Streptomyces cyaneochromogenes TaxID=2496836 RepID=A0A3Q9EXS9_9ACTN|nr:alpha/beta hydrolase [Streptomyces cyaneochromogenes]AZQ38183.1 alpha/beta hydrolase [Streptomyces cyaneochromogenes]